MKLSPGTALVFSLVCRDPDLSAYLRPSKYIDSAHPTIQVLAKSLACSDGETLLDARMVTTQRCFEYVRDEIKHSWDHKMNPVTCKASDALELGTGYCYFKSHLLAALLRANGIPAGLCYQRLTISDDGDGAPYCLHGLNAVLLPEFGWYRMDPRGSKPGILQAKFCPPNEALAFPIKSVGEVDSPEIWADPMPEVVTVLTKYETFEQVAGNLPDMEVLQD